MILEMRCSKCDSHIGYISLTSVLHKIDAKYVNTIYSGDILQEFLCDDCKDKPTIHCIDCAFYGGGWCYVRSEQKYDEDTCEFAATEEEVRAHRNAGHIVKEDEDGID